MSERAVIYVRVSTKEQDDQYTTTAQLKRCYAFAADHDLQIVRTFREAKSGWKAEARAEFFRMLEFVKEQKIPGVVFAWRDRMQRNPEDYVLLKKTGLTLHDVEGGLTFNPSNPDDYEATASYEHDVVDAKKFSARLSKRVRDSYDGLVKEGHWPHSLPLGYDRDRQGKIIIDPVRGPLIQHMFLLFSQGTWTRKAITAKMRDLGLRSRRGNTLFASQIESYLKNPFYTAGEFRWKGKTYQSTGQWEPLISKQLFREVQAVFEEKRRPIKRGDDYKYRGLFVCGLCGCAFVEEDKKYHYYRCTYQKQACNKMGSPRLKESELEQLLEVALGYLAIDQSTAEWILSQIEETYRLNRQTEAMERQGLEVELKSVLSERARAFQSFTKGLVDDEGLIKEEIARLGDRKAQIEKRLQELSTSEDAIIENSMSLLGILKNFKNQYFTASLEKRRRMDALLFRKIAIYPLKQSKEELFADLKTAFLADQYPLQIQWTELFDELFQGNFFRELGRLARERYKGDMNFWPPASKAENKAERA